MIEVWGRNCFILNLIILIDQDKYKLVISSYITFDELYRILKRIVF